ncbi:MAG: hypothetical protein CSA85_00480 [Alphaproteobacteria bacterium]|nr:MAG: hypothetical protein CSA85_00480 [Alphaproteobacteria bacterium]
MDSSGQAQGEKRVLALLVEPLQRRGLAKPTSLTKAQFGDMVTDLCARLAYMTDANLMALEEQVAANAGGKEKDRFPIGQRILEWAAQIQPPGDDASPLIRAVFAAQLGLDALAGGWAPELLAELKRNRRWPSSYVVRSVQERSTDKVRQLQRCEEALARGRDLPPEQAEWRARRLAAVAKCEGIRDMAMRGATC